MKEENEANSNQIDLKSILLSLKVWKNYLLSKKMIILCVTLCGAILGVTFSFFQKTQYTATTTFVLEESSSGSPLGNLGGLASVIGVEVGSNGGIFQGDNILELYKSTSMIRKTLLTSVFYNGKNISLLDRYIQLNNLRDRWKKDPKLKDISFSNSKIFTRLQDSILNQIVYDIETRYLNVEKLDKKLSIIKADVKATDEFFAKDFDDAIVRNVNDFYIQTKTKKNLLTQVILQQKTDSVRDVMTKAIYSIATVADATPNLNPTRQIQRDAPTQKSLFTAEANKAILSTLTQNLEMSKITLQKETPLIQVIDQPIYPLEKKKTGLLKGFVMGGFLFGFICVFYLLFRRIVKNILA